MSKTLLLADDSVTIQKVVAISFASEDVRITTVDNGDDAVARARTLHPDVILADVVMPGKSGYEVCEAVKADPSLRHIPVLLLTGTFEAFDEERARRAGAAGHVAKPFEAQALVQRVKELFAAPKPAAAPPAAAPAPEARAESDDEAFAFFDEERAMEDEDDGRYATGRLSSEGLELAPGDSAFSFGEGDWSDDDDDDAAEVEAAPIAHTVAILPDEPEEEEEAPRIAAHRPAETGDEGFDFEFESVSASVRPRETRIDSFARDAVLDPPADSGFVDPSPSRGIEGRPPTTPAGEATQVLASDFELRTFARPSPSPTGPPTDPFPEELEAEMEPDPVEPQRFAPSRFEEALEEPPPPRPVVERPAPLAAPAADLSEPEPDFAEPEPDFVEPEPYDDAPAPGLAPAAHDAVAEALLERVTPQLRDQLHETLERAAWEAFGQVTEKIVSQAVEKLESIAWEVVPKLAETLIQEEIRKLKDE